VVRTDQMILAVVTWKSVFRRGGNRFSDESDILCRGVITFINPDQ